MRTLDALVDEADPGLPVVQEWIDAATRPVEMLPCDPAIGDQTLLELQVTTRSPMGAIAHRTGGLLIDDGWVRVLGAGCERLPRSIIEWNRARDGQPTRQREAWLVGDDAVGGFFAVSGGGIPVERGKVGYFAPDRLAWEDTRLGYSGWLSWLFTGKLDRYYERERWPGWREDCRALAGDRAYSIVPPLCAKGPPPAERTRRPVPLDELWSLYVDELPRQLGPR